MVFIAEETMEKWVFRGDNRARSSFIPFAPLDAVKFYSVPFKENTTVLTSFVSSSNHFNTLQALFKRKCEEEVCAGASDLLIFYYHTNVIHVSDNTRVRSDSM